jgi:hypothetical protein
MYDDKITKHECFGSITVNRLTGSTYLFGSEAEHRESIRIEINEADMRRSLSDDRIFGSKRLVTVDMTYEQWARFVSSFGIGMGTPCTLRQVATKQYAECPEPEGFASKFQDDLKDTMKEATGKLDGLVAKLHEALLPGNKTLGKKELTQVLKDIEHAVMQVRNNVPFIEEQFGEMMERKVGAAIIEVEGTIAHGLREAGIASLKNHMPDYSRAFTAPPSTYHARLPENVEDAEIIDEKGVGK